MTTTDDDAPREEDVQRFEVWLRQSELYSSLQAALGRFLSEFASFDAFVTVLVRAVSRDPLLVEHLSELMSLENRMLLLSRLMEERNVPSEIAADVNQVLEEGRKLKSKRNEIAHNKATLTSASFDGGPPGESIPGVQRPKGRQPTLPPAGFKSQADMERYMRQSMHTVDDLDQYYERTIALNRHAVSALTKLRKAMGLEGPQVGLSAGF
jgi:hypothetical protein